MTSKPTHADELRQDIKNAGNVKTEKDPATGKAVPPPSEKPNLRDAIRRRMSELDKQEGGR